MAKKKENLDDKIEIIKIENYLKAITDDDLLFIAKPFNWDKVKQHTIYRFGRGDLSVEIINELIHEIYRVQKEDFLGKSDKYLDFLAVKKNEMINHGFGDNLVGYAKADMTGKKVLNLLAKTPYYPTHLDEHTKKVTIDPPIYLSKSEVLKYKSLFIKSSIDLILNDLLKFLKDIIEVPTLTEHQLIKLDERPTLKIKQGHRKLLIHLSELLMEKGIIEFPEDYQHTHFLRLFSPNHKYNWLGKFKWMEIAKSGRANKRSLCQLFFALNKLKIIEPFSSQELIQVLEKNFCEPNGDSLKSLPPIVSAARKMFSEPASSTENPKYPHFIKAISVKEVLVSIEKKRNKEFGNLMKSEEDLFI
tara:strand:- start:31012 stop:32091 length:1080 start_codon:yes stop_codon:yes gene_type:complete